MLRVKVQLFSLFLIAVFKISTQLQCIDQDNNPVDWYVVYKLPQEKNKNDLISQGAAYTYLTSDDIQNGWKLSSISINDSNSLIGRTLAPVFENGNQNLLYALYNDENPDGSINFKKGHTKGSVLGDGSGGIWLIHSVPRFPRVDENQYYFPHNGYTYGQTFLCISLDLQNLDKVGTQLQYNEANIYYKNMPNALTSQLSNLNDALHGKVVSTSPWYHIQPFSSKNNVRFMSFAKSSKFAKELYEDWVAPALFSNLSAETWPNGGGRVPSQCNQYFSVYNIQSVYIKPADFTFKSTTDHSKWAVSEKTTDSKWICIGDINRATPQRHRGGGTVCFNHSPVVQVFQESIASFENCTNQ